MEILLTKPIGLWKLIIGKYLGILLLVILAIVPTLLYVLTINQLGRPVGNFDVGATIGSYIGLIFLGGCYAAIGIFASSLSSNQIISFLLGVFLCFNISWIAGESRQIFLGDSGSMLLGLMLVYSLIVLSEAEVPTLKSTAAPWLLGLPLLDMCAVIILRLARRVSLISADRRHIHHLLTKSNYSKNQTL